MKIATIAFVSMLLATIPSFGAATESPDIARIVGVSNQVEISRQGRLIPAKRGDGLRESDQITTGKGTIAFVFSDRSVFILGANSSLLLSEHGLAKDRKDTSIKTFAHLIKGRILIDAKKTSYQRDLRVKVRSYVLGVRGTRFAITDSEGFANVAVLEGRIAIAKNPATDVAKVSDSLSIVAGMQGNLLLPLAQIKPGNLSPKDILDYEAGFKARPPNLIILQVIGERIRAPDGTRSGLGLGLRIAH